MFSCHITVLEREKESSTQVEILEKISNIHYERNAISLSV